MAPLHNEKLKTVYPKATEKGAHNNRAPREVARKLAAYWLAADRAFLASQGKKVAACGLAFCKACRSIPVRMRFS